MNHNNVLRDSGADGGGFSITGALTDRPTLMAMGDSLAQGCHSLTVTSRFCSECFASTLASFQGWNFVTADYPRPVLYDLEDILSRVDGWLVPGTMPLVLASIQSNIDFWKGCGWANANTKYHDNVAITGAVLNDLIQYSSKDYEAKIQSLAQHSVTDLLFGGGALLGDLHVAITGRYALNPSNDPKLADMTQLKWVELRKPKYLVVETGHNHDDSAFFGTAFDAYPIVDATNPASQGFNPTLYVTRMKALIDLLLALPAGAPDKIFLGQLPKISFVPNMEPFGPITNDYFEFYGSAFGLSNRLLSGTQVKAADDAAKQSNDAVATYISEKDKTGRIILVDNYTNFLPYDYKHGRFGVGIGKPLKIGGLAITNEYIEGLPIPSTIRGLSTYKFDRGGLGSLDGCHLSAVGYALYALSVMQLMASKCGLSAPTPDQQTKILADALNREALLTPHMLGQVEMIRQYFNAFASHQQPPEATENSTMAQVVEAGKQAALV